MRHVPEVLIMTAYCLAGFITASAVLYGVVTLAYEMGWYSA